jgi:predicted MPP superfamily phosphohydrolase
MALLSVLYLLKYNNTSVFIIISSILLLIDLLMYRSIQYFYKSKYSKLVHLIVSLFIFFSLVFVFFIKTYQVDPYQYVWIYFYTGLLFSLYIAKISFLFFSLVFLIFKKVQVRVVKSILSLVFSVVLISLVYGIYFGCFHFESRYTNKDINLLTSPKSFKIAQLSDLHLGTFPNKMEFIRKIIAVTNSQKPDMIIITGDFVNSFAEELEPFIDDLKMLKAPYGVYGVLGNHDYGDYFRWTQKELLEKNHHKILAYLQKAHIKILNNESVKITTGQDTFYLAGVENWGLYPFRQKGNLYKATRGIPKNKNILLLSHDPVFWKRDVIKNQNVIMTFSGHTHGMQIGLRFFGKEWSPFSIGKDLTSGWYEKNGQFLYINKGIGGSFYPGRIGIHPEITFFTLE